MEWTREAEAGSYTLSVPGSVVTWAALRPYLAAAWAKLLTDLPLLGPAAKPPPRLALIIDGRQGAGHVWLVLAGAGRLSAAAADPVLATAVHLEAPGVENLVSGADDGEAANCQFAREVLSAVRVPPAAAAAEAVVALHPKAVVTHGAVDPEHGWYAPFEVRLGDLVHGKLPHIRWTFDIG